MCVCVCVNIGALRTCLSIVSGACASRSRLIHHLNVGRQGRAWGKRPSLLGTRLAGTVFCGVQERCGGISQEASRVWCDELPLTREAIERGMGRNGKQEAFWGRENEARKLEVNVGEQGHPAFMRGSLEKNKKERKKEREKKSYYRRGKGPVQDKWDD